MVFAVALTFIAGCKIQTPEIRGVVLDAETKEPVADAWVRASLEIETKTLAGGVHSDLSMNEPHTRTDKKGRFVIPSKSFKKPPIPYGFGTEVISLSIGAMNIDNRGGHISYYGGYNKRHFGKGAGDLKELLEKDTVEFTIYAKPFEMTECEFFSYLQSRYRYCFSGRLGVEVPPVQGGCDAWELDFAITLHERYLERYKEVVEKEVNTVIFEQLAYLYEKKGSFEKAIETLRRSVALIERRGMLKFEVWQRNKAEIEHNIKRLEELQQNEQPQP